jgi:Domain of unknown function (DUF4386)
MQPTNRDARVAGALYLSMAIPAPFCLIYVPNLLFVRGNAAATASNIRASEMLFRTAIAANVVVTMIFLFLVLALYRLLSGVNKSQAAVMVILVLVSLPITLLNLVNELAALILVRGADFLSVFDKPHREALAMLFLRVHGQGLFIEELFWGLWLFPFGLLVMRSGFIPRILGVLLLINGLAYVVVSFTALLVPAYLSVVDKWATIPETGELWIMLWLLIKGTGYKPMVPALAEAT